MASEASPDAAWLLGTRVLRTVSRDGIDHERLYDPRSGSTWYARSAALNSAQALAALQNEVDLMPHLGAHWAAIPRATICTQDRLVVVSCIDDEPTFVAEAGGQRLSLPRFLDLAVGTARATAEAHAQGVLHRDIRPVHVIVDGDGRSRLTGFGFAALRGAPDAAMPALGDASLPYLAPEIHLGRRGGDPGADLYALGVSYYEWLMGEWPLKADSASAWRHAHLAVEPPAPRQGRPELPDVLERIVLKLMDKDPGQRYRDAGSLLADLLRCRQEWHARGAIAGFKLDASTRGTLLNRPAQLFGREAEMHSLLAAWLRVTQTARSEVVLISGPAGSGKSALTQELARRIGGSAARHATGKSDLQQQDIPYAPLAQALRSLTMALLSGDGTSLARVREAWLARLSGQGKAVAEIVPEVEHVIGPTAPLANVPAALAQTRVDQALLHTLAAFASEAPLLLVIDDLQWADAYTLGLMRAFLADPPANVLWIGACRDHPADRLSPLEWLGHARREGTIPITHVTVQPLAVESVTELVAGALNQAPTRVSVLGRAIHQKTAGNPFFAFQLLQTLVEDGVVSYLGDDAGWDWREQEVDRQPYADDVVDLMVRRFARYPRSRTVLLGHLACVGLRCSTGLLASIAQTAPDILDKRLRPLLDAGLLVRESEGYAFPHDRVLESAYALVDVTERPAVHARIAAVMIDFWQGDVAAHAFEICNQIERVAGHELSAHDRISFAKVLLVAGRRAKNSSAIESAARYVSGVDALIESSWWSSHYDVAYGASLLRCECLLAQANLAGAESEITSLLERDLPPMDRAAVYRLQAVLQTVRCDYEGAISTALAGLALLDVHLPRGPSERQLREAYDAVTRARGGRSIAALGEIDATADRRMQVVMGLLSTLVSSLFVTDGISFLHLAKLVELTLQHGATPESAYGLSWYGVFIASLYGEYEDGLEYGLAATKLIDRQGYEAERIATLVAVDQVSPWTRPLSYALQHVQQAVKQGLASGDIGMACYACNHIVSDLLVMGEPLWSVEEEIERGLKLTRSIEYRDIELILLSQHAFVHSLCRLEDGDLDTGNGEARAGAAQRLELSNSQPTRFWIHLYDGMTAVYSHDWQGALTSLRQAAALSWAAPAHINVADCQFFLALAFAHAPDDTSVEPGRVAAVEACRRPFERWASLNPRTFRSKLLLLEAEMARLRGDAMKALACYEKSAEAAAAAGFVHERALAHEYAALLCHAHGLNLAAAQHRAAAIDSYRHWGAAVKERQLSEVASSSLLPLHGAAAPHRLRSGPGVAPEWEAGMKAAQALSSEMVTERLVEALMSNLIVHAGARFGLLVLMRGDAPMIEASGRVVDGKVSISRGSTVPSDQLLPLSVLNSVIRTRKSLVLADAMTEAPSLGIRLGVSRPMRSVLCLPLTRGGDLIGALYLENNLAPDVFDAGRTAALEVLAPQVAIALETARLYEQLLDENRRRAQVEMDLRMARADLARTAHLTAMGSLAASIVHEVNQPLTAIVASVDASTRWLRRATPDLTEALDALSHVRHNALRAAEVIRALRSLAKQAPAVLEPVDVIDLVREVLQTVRMDLDTRGVRLVTQWNRGRSVVEADRIQLQQVVFNLVTNALDAMQDTPGPDKELKVVCDPRRDDIVVTVLDRGSGIPAEILPRIFDPFFTTKHDGLGMGLPICRSIVEAHGGTLAVRPRKVGTAFTFRLPARAAASVGSRVPV